MQKSDGGGRGERGIGVILCLTQSAQRMQEKQHNRRNEKWVKWDMGMEASFIY